MRALLRKHELERQPIEINSLVEDVLQLISGDASLRGCCSAPTSAPACRESQATASTCSKFC